MNHFKLRKATEKSAKIFNKTSMQSLKNDNTDIKRFEFSKRVDFIK